MSGRQVHRFATVALSVLMAVIGVALAIESIGSGASLLSGRLLLGVLFLVAGVGRLYIVARRSRIQ